jgi:hypothetical protein
MSKDFAQKTIRAGAVSIKFAWATNGLWTFTERNDFVVQHFLVNLSWMQPIGDGEDRGLMLTIWKLCICVGW